MNNLNKFKCLKDIELETGISADEVLANWRKYNINLYVNFDNEVGYLKCRSPLEPEIDGKYCSPSFPPEVSGIEDIRKFKYDNTTIEDVPNSNIIKGQASGFWVILPPINNDCPTFLLNRYMGLGHHCTEYHQVCQVFAIKDEQDLSEQTDLMNIKNRIDRRNFDFELENRLKVNKYNLFVNLCAVELLYGINPTVKKVGVSNPPSSPKETEKTEKTEKIKLESKSLDKNEITMKFIGYLLKKHYLNQENADYESIATTLSNEYYELKNKEYHIQQESIKRWFDNQMFKRRSQLAYIVLYTIICKHYTDDICQKKIIENIPQELRSKLKINEVIIMYWMKNLKRYKLI